MTGDRGNRVADIAEAGKRHVGAGKPRHPHSDHGEPPMTGTAHQPAARQASSATGTAPAAGRRPKGRGTGRPAISGRATGSAAAIILRPLTADVGFASFFLPDPSGRRRRASPWSAWPRRSPPHALDVFDQGIGRGSMRSSTGTGYRPITDGARNGTASPLRTGDLHRVVPSAGPWKTRW